MFKKTIIVLAMLLVSLLAISAVSAETDATGDIAGTDSSTAGVENTDETILASSATEELENDNDPMPVDADSDKLEMGPDEVLGDEINVTGDGFNDISQAIGDAKDGDIIYLQGKTYKGSHQIVINKNLTIIGGFEWGDGKYATLDAQQQSRIFEINAHVTLQGIKFINGVESNGGAIYVNGGCSLIDCIFINNNAKANGGAVLWNTTAIGITNCTFEDNHAKYGHGGANHFWNTVDNVNLTGNFINNTAMGIGGANSFFSAVTNVILTGNFINNTAKIYGGANNFDRAVINVTLTGNFTNNRAEIDGGAINFAGAVTNVTLTGNFINNTAETGSGGANYFDKTVNNVNLTGNFTNNHAETGFGGANYFNGAVINVILTGNFNNNHAETGFGGANYFNGAVINVILTGNFTNNSAQSGGANKFNGAVTDVTLTGTFTDNTAEIYDGGANCFGDVVTNVTLTGNFNNNTAQAGGANAFSRANNVTLTGNFTNNHAENGDGGANYFGDVVTNVTLTGNFNNNTAQAGGANYFSNTVTNVNLTGNFTNNRAETKNGGANYFKKVTNATLTGNFTNNTAEYYGGANHFDGEVSNLTLTGNFTNNRAEIESGGANYFDMAVKNVNLTGNFTNNTAYHGGANYFFRTVDNIALTGNFTNNRAEMSGGANCFDEAVTNAALIGNFINNTAKSYGGANNFWDPVTNVNLTGTFINNQAENGAANAFVDSVPDVTLTGNYINNTGENVIYIENSVSGNVIRDSIFINNAPINVKNGNIAVIDSWFGNNVTDYNVKPEVGIDLDNWLFLNGTADPNPVSVANTTNIIFTLSRYDGNNVSSYDNSRLIPIKLDITSTLGSVNPNIVNLNESTTYTPNSVGNGSVTASFENVLCTIEIEIQKAEPDMSIESYPSYAGENTTITVTLPQDATGNVTVTDAYGNNYTKPVKDGAVDIEVPNLNAGVNKLNITYSGDDEKYLSKTVEYAVQVDPMPTFLTAEVLEKYQGDDDRFAVVLTDANGNPVAGMPVKIHIVGKVYNCTTNESGVATLPINLKPGIYNVTVEFAGKGGYANATPVSSEVHVLTKVRIDKNKNLVKDYGDADKFTVRLLDEYGKPVAGEVVNMTVAGKTYHCKSNADGYASLAINLKPGTYDIVCEYAGYKVTNKITVKQVLSAYNRQYKKASSYQFTATLKHTNGNPITGKTLTFTFKGKTYTQNTNGKGEATITIKDALNIGKYNIAIKYLDSTITKTIKIV